MATIKERGVSDGESKDSPPTDDKLETGKPVDTRAAKVGVKAHRDGDAWLLRDRLMLRWAVLVPSNSIALQVV